MVSSCARLGPTPGPAPSRASAKPRPVPTSPGPPPSATPPVTWPGPGWTPPPERLFSPDPFPTGNSRPRGGDPAPQGRPIPPYRPSPGTCPWLRRPGMCPRRRALLPSPAARGGFHAGSADVPRARSRRGGEEEELPRGAAGLDPAAEGGAGPVGLGGASQASVLGVTPAGPNAARWGEPRRWGPEINFSRSLSP